MANGVTTEWEDIQVKMGNYIATEKDPSNDLLEKLIIEEVESYDPLEKKNIDELKELEDDEDDEVLKQYKEKRLQEMKDYASKPKFGKLIEIRKQDYIAEVTNAPKDVYVVIHLYQTYIEASNILTRIFENMAKKFPLVKFVNIQATNCCEGFKDENVPSILIYRNGKLQKEFIPAPYFFGGKNLSWKSKINFYNRNRVDIFFYGYPTHRIT
jgi:hypothetical protein